ncbi:MAG TPA: hypothetical protein VFQ36_11030 [Ktedonobacteraceae bacterium]|nr:hypothetical protein [Ktedonobacteraceae bacterium]
MPIPAENFREMRGESDEATAPEMQGFFYCPRIHAHLPGTALPVLVQCVARENNIDEDE